MVGRRPTGAPAISTRWPAYFRMPTPPKRYFAPVSVSANVKVPGTALSRLTQPLSVTIVFASFGVADDGAGVEAACIANIVATNVLNDELSIAILRRSFSVGLIGAANTVNVGVQLTTAQAAGVRWGAS